MTRNDEKTSKDLIFQILFDRLVSGFYPIGSRLTEQMFSAEFTISRTPIREVLHQLASLRLIELNPNKSALVLGLSCDDVEEMYDIRMALEELALESAIPKLKLHELSFLKARVEALSLETDMNTLAKVDYELHSYIVGCSAKPRLKSMLEQLFTLLIRNSSFPVTDRIQQVKLEHLKIIEALFTRDLELTKAVLKQHLENSKANAIDFIFRKKIEKTR